MSTDTKEPEYATEAELRKIASERLKEASAICQKRDKLDMNNPEWWKLENQAVSLEKRADALFAVLGSQAQNQAESLVKHAEALLAEGRS